MIYVWVMPTLLTVDESNVCWHVDSWSRCIHGTHDNCQKSMPRPSIQSNRMFHNDNRQYGHRESMWLSILHSKCIRSSHGPRKRPRQTSNDSMQWPSSLNTRNQKQSMQDSKRPTVAPLYTVPLWLSWISIATDFSIKTHTHTKCFSFFVVTKTYFFFVVFVYLIR